MSLLESLFAPGTIERLGWMLVHVLWQATAVAILLAVFLRLLRNASANLRYGAACSALALMVALPLATMRYIRTPGPVAEAGPASVTVVFPPVTEGATPKHGLSMPDSGQALDQEDTLETTLSATPVAQAPKPKTPVPLRERLASTLEPALPYVVLGWLIGVFGLSAWHLGGWTQLQRLKRRMVREIGAPLQQRLEDLSARLGLHRAVGLLESALVEVPTVVGWLRPVILLPASALTGLRPEQLEAILAHELAHIRRYDYLVNMLQTVVEILGFYHPAIWWVSRRIRIERENCCDDLAVCACGSSLQYAKALACMEEIRHGGTDLAIAATGGSLMARIARLLGRPAVEDRRFAWLPGLVALLLVIGIVIPAAFALGAGNPPQSSTDTPEDYQMLRREHVALLSRPEVQLREARTAVRFFQEHQDWEGLALAYQAAAEAMWRAIHTPAEAFTRPVPAPQTPTKMYPVAEVQTNLDGVWSPSRNTAASWIYWIQGRQKELVLERIETLMKLGGLCSERLSSPAQAVAAYQAAGREVPLFEEPLDKLIPQMWPEQAINTGQLLALTVPGAEEIRLRILRALADAQVAAGDLRGAAETRLRAMLASLISCGGDWHAQGPGREAEAFWQVARRLPPDQPLPPTLWLDILDRDRPALDVPAPEDAPHGLPLSFPGARLVIRPGQTVQTLTVSADMETPGGGGGVRCFTIIGNNFRQLGTVEWHQDNRPGREWRTATFAVPADAGIIHLEITPYNRSIFHVHELKVAATFAPAQAASTSPSPAGTAEQADREGTNTVRAEVEAVNTPEETRQVLLEFKMAKVWSDLRPDRETLLLLANALGPESPLARELGQPGRRLDMTLGEVLKRHVVPQSLSQPAGQALIDLLQSRGYLKMQVQPRMIVQNNKPAHLRTTSDEHFWMLPGSSKLERIAYGTAVDVTPHITDGNRVALDMMVELTDPVPGVQDSNQPRVSRTSAETSMIAPNDRYLVWAAMEQAADPMEADKGRQSLYIMIRPVFLQPAPGYAGPTGTPKPAQANPRQILLDVRTVTMERGALLNVGVEWSWPTAKAGVFSDPSGSRPSPGAGGWPYGVQIGYTPDRQFTDSLLAALDLLQENGQAHVSGQQILAQDGRQSRIRALTEEWYTVTAPATKQSPQSHTEAHKTETGTEVTITPHVGDNGEITVETAIEVSTSMPRARGSDLPLLTRRTAKNAVTIRDGGTVAVAGMVENRAGSNDKSVYETAVFVTAHLIPDVNEASPAALPSTEPTTQAPQGTTATSSRQTAVTGTFANADLRSALIEVSKQSGVPIVPDPNVTGSVNVTLQDVSLEEALEMLLAGKPYVFKKMPHYYLVTERSLTLPPPETFETRRIRLSYAPALRAKALLSPIFAPYVQVEPSRTQDPNDESHTLIVTAPPALVDRIVADIKEIDRRKPLVLLDARVVVLEPKELQNLVGLEWTRPPVRPMASSPSTLPKTIVPPMGCAPDRAATDSLMMMLNLLQENGRADIIANPKVIAQDGRQALMKVIQEEWLMMTVPSTSDPFYMREELQKIEPGTVMTITPRAGDNDDIMLEMAVEISESIPKARGSDLPLIARRTVKNTVTVKDGGTVAVTGLIENHGRSSEKRAPTLADIPLIGELFKNRNGDKSNREVAVFVTAHRVPEGKPQR